MKLGIVPLLLAEQSVLPQVGSESEADHARSVVKRLLKSAVQQNTQKAVYSMKQEPFSHMQPYVV